MSHIRVQLVKKFISVDIALLVFMPENFLLDVFFFFFGVYVWGGGVARIPTCFLELYSQVRTDFLVSVWLLYVFCYPLLNGTYSKCTL